MNLFPRQGRDAVIFTHANRFSLSHATECGIDNLETSTQAWNSLIDELLRIRNLKDNWDGEGSEAPHPALVDGAIKLIQKLDAYGLSPADRVIASVNGTVYFEWHTPCGYQEIEVTSPLDAEWRQVHKDSDKTVVITIVF